MNLERERARKTRTPYRVTARNGVFTLWKCCGGLAFFVASTFTMDELSKMPSYPKARGAGIPIATLRSI